MIQVPRSAMILGFAGVLPFLWGVGTLVFPAMQSFTISTIGPRFAAPFVLVSYGQVILCFMSGVLWGFAAAHDGPRAPLGYALSVLPALWAFFMVGASAEASAINLITGFLAVLMIDWLFWHHKLAPPWWMSLRIPLTALVCLCLLTAAL